MSRASDNGAPHRGSGSRYSVTVTKRDLDTFVSRLREKNYSKATVAIRTTVGWDDDTTWGIGDDAVSVTSCTTPLQLRAAIDARDTAPGGEGGSADTRGTAPWRFFLTPLGDDDLPLDLREKLVPYLRVYLPDPSENLRTRFAATRQRSGVVADARDIPAILAFLDNLDAHVTPAPAGLLSASHLNGELTRIGLFDSVARHGGLDDESSINTLADLIEWSQREGADGAWHRFTRQLPDEVVDAAIDSLAKDLGPDAGAALRHLRSHGPAHLMAFGLAGEVLVPAPGCDEVLRAKAEGKFEMLTGLRGFELTELKAWSEATRRAFARLDDERKNVAATAQAIVVDDLAAADLLISSTVLPAGLDARYDSFADALDKQLDAIRHRTGPGSRAGNATANLIAAQHAVHAHHAAVGTRDTDTVDACVRLIQWLATDTGTDDRSLSAWLTFYRDELSWVDSCLNAAWWRQSNRRLGDVAAKLATIVRERRVTFDRAFAAAVAKHGTRTPAQPAALMIEEILSRVVEPLLTVKDTTPADQSTNDPPSAVRPMLFLVLDGCSAAAANDLVQSIMSTYPGTWNELLPADDRLRTALAALPTVTTTSRASLLSGAITRGGQNVEKKNFTARLASSAGGNDKVVLLHKNDIATGINDRVRDLVEDTAGAPVVGAVLNTIDDSLASDSPMNKKWRIGDIGFLPELLEGAARVGRTVVLVSDHGHVPERHTGGMTAGTDATSARWRPADGTAPDADEVLVDGDRVMAGQDHYGDDVHRAILAIDEDRRYTAKAAGYHGGLSPAEACVPVTVLTQAPTDFADNTVYPGDVLLRSTRFPSWWEIRDPEVHAPAPARDTKRRTPSSAAAKSEPSLFDASGFDANGKVTVDSSEKPDAPVRDSFSELISSAESTLRDQFQAHQVTGRRLVDVVDLLRDIDRNNRRMPVAALKARWELVPLQLQGVIAELRRVVNMDGVEVLTVEGTDLVLNSEMLFSQFGTGKGR